MTEPDRTNESDVRFVRLSELHEDTAGVIKDMLATRKPVVVLYHGHILAMIKPLDDRTLVPKLIEAYIKAEGIDLDAN